MYPLDRRPVPERLTLSLLVIALAGLPACLTAGPSTPTQQQHPDPTSLLRQAIDNWRGLSSYSELTMTIQRSDWQRTLGLRAWTSGDERSLIRVISPASDKGNATLTDERQMWSFTPRVNRVIKIPASMMSRNWMGSDFSNKDISRSSDILDDYVHTLTNTRDTDDGHRIYEVTSIPHDDSAVVWGMEVVEIRDDHVFLRHTYHDQDMQPVKQMETLDFMKTGDRIIARTIRMFHFETPEEWTEIRNQVVEFDLDLPAGLFTLSNLRNPRQ